MNTPEEIVDGLRSRGLSDVTWTARTHAFGPNKAPKKQFIFSIMNHERKIGYTIKVYSDFVYEIPLSIILDYFCHSFTKAMQ